MNNAELPNSKATAFAANAIMAAKFNMPAWMKLEVGGWLEDAYKAGWVDRERHPEQSEGPAQRLVRGERERAQNPLMEVCKFCECRKGAKIHEHHAFIPTGRFHKHTDATNRREMPCDTCEALDHAEQAKGEPE